MKWALACLAVVAATAGPRGQSGIPGWFEVPMPGSEQALAALGVTRADRAHTLSLAARMPSGKDSPTRRPITTAAEWSSDRPTDGEALTVPAPLTAKAWGELLALERGEELGDRLVNDRAGLLVAAGFTSTDESIRQLAMRDRAFLERVHRDAPGAFAAFARSLRIEQGQVVVPGNPGADKIWEALAGASPAEPKQFIIALLTKDAGRLAWYFDTLTTLDPARLRAAWPLGPEKGRMDNARALYESFRRVEWRWRIEEQPFRRNAGDPWMVLNFVDTHDQAVVGPAWRWFWQALFTSDGIDRVSAARVDRRAAPPVSVVWVARQIAPAGIRERKERFDMVRLAQRVFPAARESDVTDLLIALGGYRRYSAVLLSLERMQIDTPRTWAELVEAARHVDQADGEHTDALAAFQGAFALVCRLWHVGSIDSDGAEQLLRSLGTAVRANQQVPQSVARWISATLMPTLRPQTVLDALAGPAPADTRAIQWEDLDYQLDFAAAERARLDRIFSLIKAPALDAAIASNQPAAIAAAIKTLAYAVALGDPEGAVTLGPDIATRHDFGVSSITPPDDITPWALPVEMQIEGRPWHVRGSLIGLELGLARLSLRHLSGEQMPSAPTMTTNVYATLAQTVASMRPTEFTDTDRDEIVAALARGRRRVADAGADIDRWRALAGEADLSPSTRELLPWIAAHEPQSLDTLFSMRDLLWLGRPNVPRDRLDAWGMHAHALDGRLTRTMPRSRAWEDFAGRADTGIMATQVPDLTLRLAEETARLRLPAALVPATLTYATQDFWYAVRARFADDWTAMSRQAVALRPERAEDYVAALAGSGPLRLRGAHQ